MRPAARGHGGLIAGAAEKASAQALFASQLAAMSAQQRANVLAQFGPVAKLTVTECRTIGRSFPHRHSGS